MTCQTDSAVVFFSRDGNTRCGAQLLSQRLDARLVELKELKPGNALNALFRMKTPLAGNPWAEIASARRVYLLCPIWAGNSVPAMNAFAALMQRHPLIFFHLTTTVGTLLLGLFMLLRRKGTRSHRLLG